MAQPRGGRSPAAEAGEDGHLSPRWRAFADRPAWQPSPASPRALSPNRGSSKGTTESVLSPSLAGLRRAPSPSRLERAGLQPVSPAARLQDDASVASWSPTGGGHPDRLARGVSVRSDRSVSWADGVEGDGGEADVLGLDELARDRPLESVLTEQGTSEAGAPAPRSGSSPSTSAGAQNARNGPSTLQQLRGSVTAPRVSRRTRPSSPLARSPLGPNGFAEGMRAVATMADGLAPASSATGGSAFERGMLAVAAMADGLSPKPTAAGRTGFTQGMSVVPSAAQGGRSGQQLPRAEGGVAVNHAAAGSSPDVIGGNNAGEGRNRATRGQAGWRSLLLGTMHHARGC